MRFSKNEEPHREEEPKYVWDDETLESLGKKGYRGHRRMQEKKNQ